MGLIKVNSIKVGNIEGASINLTGDIEGKSNLKITNKITSAIVEADKIIGAVYQ